jgi:hypothetical protein
VEDMEVAVVVARLAALAVVAVVVLVEAELLLSNTCQLHQDLWVGLINLI